MAQHIVVAIKMEPAPRIAVVFLGILKKMIHLLEFTIAHYGNKFNAIALSIYGVAEMGHCLKLTDAVEGSPLDAGKLVLSPTRTYAPVVKKMLDELRPQIHGMVHCSGGAQTKVLHFVDNVKVVKNNMFPVPPLFKTIKEQSGTDWQEMYKVFNMGHRLEVYLPAEKAQEVIEISKSFGIDAQIIGRVEASDHAHVTLHTENGVFEY